MIAPRIECNGPNAATAPRLPWGASGTAAPLAYPYEEQHDMEMETLPDLYGEELKDLDSAEN